MKLIKIKIIHFGQFSNFTFDLPAENLNVFFGTNEAGKSTVVAFIKQVLFGFHLGKRTSDFFEDYQPLERVSPMGGSLIFVTEAGQQFELERLYASGKGSKRGTLTVKCDGQIVPESLFFDQIKNINGDFYANSFIFNQDMLVKVLDIKQTDLQERIYYLGAANSDKLINLREDFAKGADKLFKNKGKVPPLNKLITQMQDQKVQLDTNEGEFSQYQVLDADLHKQEKLQNENSTQLQQLQVKLNKITQLRKLMPNYRKLQELKTHVKDVKFDQQQYQLAQKLHAQQQNLHEAITKLEQQLEQVTKTSEIISVAKLVQKKPELLQWQAEYRSCEQKIKQISQFEQQLFVLNPDLTKIAAFDQNSIKKLQQDYQSLPAEEAVIQTTDSSKIGLIAGGVLIIIGLVLLTTSMKIVGSVILLGGLAFTGWSIRQHQQQQKKQAAQHARLVKSKQQRAAFNKQYGLDLEHLDLSNLLNQWRQYQQQEQEKQANQKQIVVLQEQVTQLAQEVSSALQQSIVPDFKVILSALDSLAEQETKRQQQKDVKKTLKNSLAENHTALKETQLKFAAVLAKAGVTSLDDYDQLQIKKQEQVTLKTQIAALTTNLQEDLPQLEQFLRNKQEIQLQENNLQKEIIEVEKHRQLLENKIAEIKVQLNNLANSNAVFTAKQNLANTQTKFYNQSVEYFANLFTSKWISRALDLASNERFPKMLITAKEYLQLLTNNRYNNIKIDKKLSVVRADGKSIKVQYLSRGTQEQLYFALKLAFIQQIKDQINLPILIDDSFVNFDDQRTSQIEQLLRRIAQDSQVLIFTAQTKLVKQLQLQPLTFTKGTENV